MSTALLIAHCMAKHAAVIRKRGPALWEQLHRRSLEPVADAAIEEDWVRHLVDPLKGCNCAKHWTTYLASNPPIVEPSEAYFKWTVDAHNAINARLKKPVVSYNEARSQWSQP